jgi:hypothetical protein
MPYVAILGHIAKWMLSALSKVDCLQLIQRSQICKGNNVYIPYYYILLSLSAINYFNKK